MSETNQVTDSQRQSSLHRMKAIATLLFVAAAAVFVLSLQHADEGTWGYVRAASEAAMVGALADWFAVTALFRHPLGLPIPHTAIIKKRKDQIGSALGSFVRDNFLTDEVIRSRLGGTNIAQSVGEWMLRDDNAELVRKQSSALVGGIVEVLEDDKVQSLIEDAVRNKLEVMSAPELGAKLIDGVVSGGHHQMIFDAALRGLTGYLEDNAQTFREKFSEESPWWVPGLVDDRLYNKVYDAVQNYITEINNDPSHPLRQDFDRKLVDYRQSLETSEAAQEAAQEWKDRILANDEIAEFINSIWNRVKVSVVEGIENPESMASQTVREAVNSTGQRLTTSEELQSKVNGWIADAASYVAQEYKGVIADLIQNTVEGWDAQETADRLELQVGRDLQFIRINGTIVGGLAGVAIHAVAELL